MYLYQILIYNLAKVTKYFVDDPNFESMSPFKNPDCEDEMKIIVEQTSPKISGIKVKCRGCALMKAAINAICLEIDNRTTKEAVLIINNYLDMLNGLKYYEVLLSENLRIMNLFKDSETRRGCIMLGAESMKKILTRGGS